MNNPQEEMAAVATDYGLSEVVYSCGYRLRLQYSSFQATTIRWLIDNCHDLITSGRPEILSLGCGDGAFDIEIIKHLAKTKSSLLFHGVDYNATDLNRFRQLLLSEEGLTTNNVHLYHRKYDSSSTLPGRYDLIYMIHFLQSFEDEDILPVIRNTLAHLKPDGRLLIIQQKRQGIYELKQRFKNNLTNQKFHSSEEITRLLQEHHISFSSHTIDTYFDISLMHRVSLDALLLMSFCFTDDLAKLSQQQQEEIRHAFLEYANINSEGTPVIYEPMEAIVCHA